MSHSTLRQFIIDSQCLFPGYEKASVEEIKSGEEICKYKLKKSKRTLSNVINNEGEYNPRMIREAFLNKIRFFLYPEQRVNTTDDLISDGEFIVNCIHFLCNKTYGNIRISSFLSILTLGILDFEELKV